MPGTDADRQDAIHEDAVHEGAVHEGAVHEDAPVRGPGPASGAPSVHSTLDGEVATVTVRGDLTEDARRPLVRTMTDLLLGVSSLRRVRLDLRGVPFMGSAGLAVLVQVQRMAAPRGIEVVLVDPPAVVARPLQLTGLWHRFPIVDADPEG